MEYMKRMINFLKVKMTKTLCCPQCGNEVNQTEIIWKFPHEERIADCCFDCENLMRPIPKNLVGEVDEDSMSIDEYQDFINGNRFGEDFPK
jgi:transcription elongation factor Elf1